MSIHQLTTLAGTASKPYLLRGNQQVTDQIHYGAAPAAGGSRAGAVSRAAAPGPGGLAPDTGGLPALLRRKRAPPGTRAGTTSLGCLENACALSTFFSFARGRETGIPGELRVTNAAGRPHQRPVLSGCSGATASARPSQEKGIQCSPRFQSWREGPVCKRAAKNLSSPKAPYPGKKLSRR